MRVDIDLVPLQAYGVRETVSKSDAPAQDFP